MQYEFKYISTDNYELVYTNTKKEEVKIPFTRTTKMARDLQRIQVDARMEMYSALAEKGMTKEDLIIKRNDGEGHVIYDETNLKSMENDYLELISGITIVKLMEEAFKKDVDSIMLDMGMDIEGNQEKNAEFLKTFTMKFMKIINGSEEKETPSV